MVNEENEPNPCLVAFLFPLPITKWHAVIRPQINPPEFPAPIHSSKFWRSESQPHSIKDDDSCEMICWIFHWISGGGGEQSRKSSFRLEILPWITERKRIKRLLRWNILPRSPLAAWILLLLYYTQKQRTDKLLYNLVSAIVAPSPLPFGKFNPLLYVGVHSSQMYFFGLVWSLLFPSDNGWQNVAGKCILLWKQNNRGGSPLLGCLGKTFPENADHGSGGGR